MGNKTKYILLKNYRGTPTKVGVGSYGLVHLGQDVQSKRKVAIKIVNGIHLNEAAIHAKIKHQNIVQLLDCWVDETNNKTYLVLEYIDGGNLFDLMQTSTITKNYVYKHFRAICEAVLYLHVHKLMHRDIKPENILITSDGTAKLCDFGFVTEFGERKTYCGTSDYMAPEMIQNKSYSHKVDIWALGVLLYQMIAGKIPFHHFNPYQSLKEMRKQASFGPKFTDLETDLIRKMLSFTAAERPQLHQILSDMCFQTSTTNQIRFFCECSKGSRIELLSVNNLKHVKTETSQLSDRRGKVNSTKMSPNNTYYFQTMSSGTTKEYYEEIWKRDNKYAVFNQMNKTNSQRFENKYSVRNQLKIKNS